MAVYHPTKVTCSCGQSFEANLADSINAGRTPAIRLKILAGEFHRVRCPACGRVFAAEKPFYYTDLARNAVFQVRQRSQRYRYVEDSKQLAGAVNAIPETLSTADGRRLNWLPGQAPNPPATHPWWRAGFGPRLAYENTGANWYLNFATWHRVGGRAFFINYWYRAFMAVDVTALNLVAQMPSSYAAMSHFEFFAELYSLYYDKDDPQRSVIPAPVAQWLDANIGTHNPANPTRPAARSLRISPGRSARRR